MVRCRQLSKPRMWANFDLQNTITQDGEVKVGLAWQARELTTVRLPAGTKIQTPIRVHRRAAPVFTAWFDLWGPAECACVEKFSGSFVPRLMRGAKNLAPTTNPTRDWNAFLSRHSRGIAVDLNGNYPANLIGKPGVPLGEKGSLHPVIEAARNVRVEVVDPNGEKWTAGIVCGFDWSPKQQDACHFEIGMW